ncbi:hypothetical protein [Acinetobacter calcoaceticus]|uniref:hypothetical protein n=1 Tax=Acinetobacter calcoaceticus TaxID=471 RepID=UPI0030082B72
MSNTIDKTNLDDLIKASLVNATENSTKLAKAVNVFLRDMTYQGYWVTQVFLEDGIKIVDEGDYFQALQYIFGAQYSCVILKNDLGDRIICHIEFSKACKRLLANYGITSLCPARRVDQEGVLLQLIKKAENIFLKKN